MLDRIYTGVGSRETPDKILELMREIGEELSIRGFILRSGGAKGADTAFEEGHKTVFPAGNLEIYLPWLKFNGREGIVFDKTTRKREAKKIASKVHPAWERCNDAAKRFHARNVYQVFGEDLKTPSDFVICWTEGGAIKGGTATAINLAKEAGIPVINLGDKEWQNCTAEDVFKHTYRKV